MAATDTPPAERLPDDRPRLLSEVRADLHDEAAAEIDIRIDEHRKACAACRVAAPPMRACTRKRSLFIRRARLRARAAAIREGR